MMCDDGVCHTRYVYLKCRLVRNAVIRIIAGYAAVITSERPTNMWKVTPPIENAKHKVGKQHTF